MENPAKSKPENLTRGKAHENLKLGSRPRTPLIRGWAAAWVSSETARLAVCPVLALSLPLFSNHCFLSHLCPVCPFGANLLPSRHEESPGLFCLLISECALLINTPHLVLCGSEVVDDHRLSLSPHAHEYTST